MVFYRALAAGLPSRWPRLSRHHVTRGLCGRGRAKARSRGKYGRSSSILVCNFTRLERKLASNFSNAAQLESNGRTRIRQDANRVRAQAARGGRKGRDGARHPREQSAPVPHLRSKTAPMLGTRRSRLSRRLLFKQKQKRLTARGRSANFASKHVTSEMFRTS